MSSLNSRLNFYFYFLHRANGVNMNWSQDSKPWIKPFALHPCPTSCWDQVPRRQSLEIELEEKLISYVHHCSQNIGKALFITFLLIYSLSSPPFPCFLVFFPLLYLFSIQRNWTPNFPFQTCSSSFTFSSVSGIVSNHPLIPARKKPTTHLVKTQLSHTLPCLIQYWGLSSAYCLIKCLKLARSSPFPLPLPELDSHFSPELLLQLPN